MSLPVINYPIHKIYLLSLDREVKFRPFLVKEEKILLIAKESRDTDTIRGAITQIIQNCCAEELDITTLPLFDIEMIFVKLRATSVGETVQLVFNCKNAVGEPPAECGYDTDYTLNLDKVVYEKPDGHNDTVMLTDTVGLKLRYPKLDMSVDFNEEEELYIQVMRLLVENIECIFDAEAIYKSDEVGEEELLAFVENMTVEKLAEIQNFYTTAPKVVLQDEVACAKCGFMHKVYSEDLIGFFI